MIDFLDFDSINVISKWNREGKKGVPSVKSWATLLALVLMDEEIADSALGARDLASFVSNRQNLCWSQPFTTTTHREGQTASGYFREYLQSDDLWYLAKEDFVHGFNGLMENCYDRIRAGEEEFNWLLANMITFCWATNVSLSPITVEKILLSKEVDAWTRSALADFYSGDKNRNLPFHLRLTQASIVKIKESIQDDPDLDLMRSRLESIKKY